MGRKTEGLSEEEDAEEDRSWISEGSFELGDGKGEEMEE